MPLPPATPPECPVCGAAVPRGAKACPECGADERSGWNEDATRYDGLDLPDSAFAAEGDSSNPPGRRAPNNLSWLWWLVGIGLIALLILGALR